MSVMSAWPVEVSPATHGLAASVVSAKPPSRGVNLATDLAGSPIRDISHRAVGNVAGLRLRAVADAHVHPVVQTKEVGRVDVGEPRVAPVHALGPHDREVNRVSHDRV